MKKIYFGYKNLPVKGKIVLSCFCLKDDGKVFYSMKVIGRIINPKRPIGVDNVEPYPENSQFYLHKDEPLMTIEGKQRRLPRGAATCALADDPREFQEALAKFARVMRNSRPFTAVFNEIR